MTDKYNQNEIGGNQGQKEDQGESVKNPATQQDPQRKSNQGTQSGNMPKDNR